MIKTKEAELKNILTNLSSLKNSQVEQRSQINEVEKSLLEKEFELRELESEKNIKSQDVKLSQALKELKSRCRGYLGQFFELVKPINNNYDIAVKVSL